jgi:hypothetical protein
LLYSWAGLDPDPPICASHITWMTGMCHMCHWAQLLVEMCHCAWSDLKQQSSQYLPPIVARITGVSHHTWLVILLFIWQAPCRVSYLFLTFYPYNNIACSTYCCLNF